MRESDGLVPKVDFGEVHRRKRAREGLLEHWVCGLLDHVAGVSVDVGPELGDDVVQEL